MSIKYKNSNLFKKSRSVIFQKICRFKFLNFPIYEIERGSKGSKIFAAYVYLLAIEIYSSSKIATPPIVTYLCVQYKCKIMTY